MGLTKVYDLIFDSLSRLPDSRPYDAYLVGYYGMHNSGDDALLAASLMGASDQLKAEKLIVSSMHSEAVPKTGGKVNRLYSKQLFKGQNRLKHYYGALKSKRIIFGGGSVFHSKSDIQLKRHLLKLSNGQLSLALGVGLGPFESQQAEQECRLFLNECGFIGVRDEQSLRIAQNLAPKANVELTFDLAPMLTLSPRFTESSKRDKGVLINVCPVPTDAHGKVDPRKHHCVLEKISQIIEEVWCATRLPITLISLNGHQTLGDDGLCKELVRRFQPHFPVRFEPYENDPIQVLRSITGFQVFLSMRLHGCVYGYLTNTPVMAINYHPKCEQWCEQIGLPNKHRFNVDNFSPRQLVETMVQGLTSGFTTPALAVNDAVKLSLLNWRHHHE